MELFSEELVLALRFFSEGIVSEDQLREYLADRFFNNILEKPFERLLLGELEITLAEYERGDRQLFEVQNVARDLSNSAIILAQNLGVDVDHEPAFALM